jgi:glycosyltransferase involved in cell wall biosynthesis
VKILCIANGISGHNPGLAGGETRFIEIAKSWSSMGHEVHLMSSYGGQTLCNKFGLDVILHEFIDLKIQGRLSFVFKTLKSIFFLPPSLKDFDEGLVYSTNEMLLDVFPALRLKLRHGKKIKWAVVVHWLPPFPPWKRKQSSVINSTIFFIGERLSVWIANWFADVLLPVSPMTEAQLRAEGVKMGKVHAVECGVNYQDILNVTASVTEKKYDAVYMKRLQAVKGVFDLVTIWGKVVKSKPEAKLLIMGEGIDGEKARIMAKAMGLERNIEFTGVVYDLKEKFSHIAEGRLFVLPTYEENWAIVVGEALAAGTPVISYNLREMVDVWGESVQWIPVGDTDAFAAKILGLLGNDKVLCSLSENGRKYVAKYDWQAIGEKELNFVMGR